MKFITRACMTPYITSLMGKRDAEKCGKLNFFDAKKKTRIVGWSVKAFVEEEFLVSHKKKDHNPTRMTTKKVHHWYHRVIEAYGVTILKPKTIP